MSIEAMKQALHALQLTQEGSEFAVHLPEEWSWAADKDYATMREAIDALRAAIAEASMQRLADVQQEMEQKPVAWMYDFETEGEVVRDWVSQDYYEAHSPTMGCHNVRPLYTHPPRRDWVGLTEEEITACKRTEKRYLSSQEFARAIEAKLKEKNS